MNDKEKLEEILEFLEKKQTNSQIDNVNYDRDDYLYLEGIRDATENIYHNVKEIANRK